ncbi:TPA: serine hydrolase domain-containing protein [Streptococcus pyogenes]|uniref:Class A beta-lactamase-related serine hydrolase n=1 Tax=Streptococcus pyogenes TaxID=1314 RepID=A0A5S4TDH6_STRPY|nr:serine hydrolase domain-containing protein [Streptococcus pyogenes]HER4687002.1 beta-lactamase family protein [Streptococcus pyogenes NGAS364]HER4777710.1 beta-lactamase family protein [Streptococcus pyogenes NGAS169]QAX69953.1 class A beta-lactamase-related serine hydrolase [Streptococcus pyogenes]TYK84750.1 class A beta-lactamase-related serine hydrolase [Streptococcus pyogenes]TYK94411.1 class A beta-lactamase-related serine hydrolase [Streptococcus pyogenes]
MVYEMTLAVIKCIENHLHKKVYKGASLALFQSGRWQEYHIGTIDGRRPVDANLVYDLASVSKVVGVATICNILLNNGTLALDDPLKVYYPSIADTTVTIRQLLTHTSGLDPYIPNRDVLNAQQLRKALNHLTQKENKNFYYTDVNFLLLGFMLEELFSESLDQIFDKTIFTPFGMYHTSFGPRPEAVPTLKGVSDGEVHDPKAKILKKHSGSAGLFSTLADLESFSNHYLNDPFSDCLWRNYSQQTIERSLGWNLDGDWISHTGYTGAFLMLNKKEQTAAIFLTNRTYDEDDKSKWLKERQLLYNALKHDLTTPVS